MPETGTVVPLPPSERRLKEAETLATPQNFVPGTSVAAGQWASSGPARRMVPVGVAGELGSSYTVFEKNWTCPECHTENYASKARCLRCRARKPAGGGGLIRGGAAPAADEAADDAAADPNAAAHGEWKEVFDPDSKQLYYANGATGETRWDRPLEMGPTPHASGWFGRGAAGSKAADGYEANNAAYLKRPARKQVDYIASKNTVLEGAYESRGRADAAFESSPVCFGGSRREDDATVLMTTRRARGRGRASTPAGTISGGASTSASTGATARTASPPRRGASSRRTRAGPRRTPRGRRRRVRSASFLPGAAAATGRTAATSTGCRCARIWTASPRTRCATCSDASATRTSGTT